MAHTDTHTTRMSHTERDAPPHTIRTYTHTDAHRHTHTACTTTTYPCDQWSDEDHENVIDEHNAH